MFLKIIYLIIVLKSIQELWHYLRCNIPVLSSRIFENDMDLDSWKTVLLGSRFPRVDNLVTIQ